MLRSYNPALDSMDAIRKWAQQLIDQRIRQMAVEDKESRFNHDMTPDELYNICSEEIDLYFQPMDLRKLETVGEDAETVDLETARAMLHQTIREEYAKV